MIAVRVQDTLTGDKVELKPGPDGRVRIYVCGVTPYDEAHIGHARPSVFWDVVRRYLVYKGMHVTLVQNFTDVDDKIIARSAEEGRDPIELAREYAGRYLEDMDYLKVQRADVYPMASEHVPEMLEIVKALVEKGYAYEVDGNVYFSVRKFPRYGHLSGRTLDEMKSGARVEVDESKRDPLDFALWKRAKPGEPSWDSPWGPGRPGWHIECSAMGLKYLGNGFEVHGGGEELIFPHHENEIAQSEAYTGESPFVKCWVHNGLVNVEAEKMSKSLKNFVTIGALRERYSPEVLRFYLLSCHYRRPLQFSYERLDAAAAGLARLQNAVDAISATIDRASPQGSVAGGRTRDDRAFVERVREHVMRFDEAMSDDFNTALALGVLFELARDANSYLGGEDFLLTPGTVSALEEARRAFEELAGGVLGLLRDERVAGGEDLAGELIALLLDVRQAARRRKDYDTADLIRERLDRLGIVVEDTPQGTRCRRRR